MKKKYSIPATAGLLLILAVGCSDPGPLASADPGSYTMVINEFMVNNHITTGILDSAGQAEDWVELYNTGTEAVNLEDLFLSDDPDDPAQSRLPDTLIPPGGYYVAWGGDANLGFGFSTDPTKGEEIILAIEDGGIVDRYAYLENTEAYVEGRSFGRNPDGGDTWRQQGTPSPGAANGD